MNHDLRSAIGAQDGAGAVSTGTQTTPHLAANSRHRSAAEAGRTAQEPVDPLARKLAALVGRTLLRMDAE